MGEKLLLRYAGLFPVHLSELQTDAASLTSTRAAHMAEGRGRCEYPF